MDKFPARTAFIHELRALLECPTGPHLFVRGAEACGKTSLVRAILADHDHVYYCKHDYNGGFELSTASHLICLDDAEWWLANGQRQARLILALKGHRVILISRWPWLRFGLNCPHIELHLPPLDHLQMATVIKLSIINDNAILGQFVNHVVCLSRGLVMHPRRMVQLMRQLWPIYAEPALLGSLPWDHAQLSLRANARFRPILEAEQAAMAITQAMVIGLTSLERWLLLAAYIASQTKSKNDLAVFGNLRRKGKPRKEAPLGSPRMFPADRLLAIFYRLCPLDRHPAINAVRVRLHSLIHRGLILRISSETNIEQPKLRCNLTVDVAYLLARHQSIPLEQYL